MGGWRHAKRRAPRQFVGRHRRTRCQRLRDSIAPRGGLPLRRQSGRRMGQPQFDPGRHGLRICRVYVAIGARLLCRLSGLRLVRGQRRWHRAEIQSGPSGTFVMQIGTKGACDATKTAANPFSSCGETNDFNSSHTKLNEPADITVDPLPGPVTHATGDTYIADGYGNHRVVVFDAQGNYVGQWGTTSKLPPPNNPTGTPVPSIGQNCPPGTFGATGSGHPHCVVLGDDGLVYVCDRPNSRIQVFNKNCAVPSTTANPEPVCQPVRIINISGFNSASADDRAAKV